MRPVLNEAQKTTLAAVRAAAPNATAKEVARKTHRSVAVAQHTLDALTRRGLVTPEIYSSREVYFATPKGDRY